MQSTVTRKKLNMQKLLAPAALVITSVLTPMAAMTRTPIHTSAGLRPS